MGDDQHIVLTCFCMDTCIRSALKVNPLALNPFSRLSWPCVCCIVHLPVVVLCLPVCLVSPMECVKLLGAVEEACPAGLHHSGFFCGNHQPKIFFEIPNVSAACCCLHQWWQLLDTTDEGSSKLPKRLVFQRKSLVGDFRKRTLSAWSCVL